MRQLVMIFLLALISEVFRLSLLARLPVHPDILLGIVVLSSLNRSPQMGALTGFLLGMIRDVFYSTPVGLEALPMMGIGWVVASLGRSVYREAIITHIVVLLLAGLAKASLGYLFLRGGELSGFFAYLFRVAFPSAFLTAILVPLIYQVVRGFFGHGQGLGQRLTSLIRKYEKKIFVKR